MKVITQNSTAIRRFIECEAYDAFESDIDTRYFGVPTAKVLLKNGCESGENQDTLIQFMKAFELVMITNKGNHPVNNLWLGKKTSAFLTDVNVQFRKNVCHPGDANSHISISDQVAQTQQIIYLAETSFTFSRFKNDPYLPVEKARNIYADIVNNAFGKAGRFFARYETKGTTAGFMLFSMNKQTSTATVELIAIDQNSTGQGIGPSIIRAVETFVCENGIETLRVGTQLDNIHALKFYSSYGFKIVECSSIYHYWPQK